MRPRSVLAAIPVIAVVLVGLVQAPPAYGQWQIKNDDGTSSIKFGFLAVMRADQEELANGEDAQNLYFRRLRFLAGGKLTEKWSFFFETDSPNLGKSDAAGNKNAGDIYVQDFYVEYAKSASFKAAFGMLLIPLSHNSNQSAASHLASDYGPYSFLESGPTKSRVGRDYGVMIRGNAADSKLEYRLGAFDGDRQANASGDLRYAGRVVYHVFDPETGMFYTGNNLGAKRQLSIGASFDVQDDYQAVAGDIFIDQPVGSSGSAFTLQVDAIQYDGGTTFASLPKQTTYLVELGYWIPSSKIQPWIQYAQRDFDNDALADQDQTWVGVNYRLAKHNRVVRFAYGQLGTDGAADRDVLQITFQMLQF